MSFFAYQQQVRGGKGGKKVLNESNKEEEKLHCDWQMNQELKRHLRGLAHAHWPKGMHAKTDARVRWQERLSFIPVDVTKNNVEKPEGIQIH